MIHAKQHPAKDLPFFVNGSLQGAAFQQIEQHLAECAECRREVAMLQVMRMQVKAAADSNGPGDMGWQRLKKQIRDTGRAAKRQSVRVWQAVAAVAVLAVAIQSSLLYRSDTVTEGYQTLGFSETSLQVSFYPNVTEVQIRQILNEINARIVDGPGALGVYRIELQNVANGAAASKARRNMARSQLAADTGRVKYVSD